MMATSKRTTSRQLPAEWEPQSAILLALPHEATDWHYMLPEVHECYRQIIEAITRFENVIVFEPQKGYAIAHGFPGNERICYVDYLTNDTWTRDYGPISVRSRRGNEFIDFKFNGWGLKFPSDRDNLASGFLFEKGIFAARRRNELSFVLEGGSIESNNCGVILSTSECLLSPNRNGGMTERTIEYNLKRLFGAEKILMLDHGNLEGDDTDGHIDTLARFTDPKTIAYVKCSNPNDSHYEALKKMEEQLATFSDVSGEKFNLVPLPFPDAIYDEEGLRLPATYANFLIINDAVLVPTYNQPANDSGALATIGKLFPDRQVIGIDCRALIKQHGSLHCATMQFPSGMLKNLPFAL